MYNLPIYIVYFVCIYLMYLLYVSLFAYHILYFTVPCCCFVHGKTLSSWNDPIFFCSLHWRNLSLYNKITTTHFKQIRFWWKYVIKFRGKVYSNFFKFVQQLFFLSVQEKNLGDELLLEWERKKRARSEAHKCVWVRSSEEFNCVKGRSRPLL